MRLRIRHANGIATLNNVSNEQTVAELKQQILQTLQLSSTYGIQSKLRLHARMHNCILLKNTLLYLYSLWRISTKTYYE